MPVNDDVPAHSECKQKDKNGWGEISRRMMMPQERVEKNDIVFVRARGLTDRCR